MEIPMWRTNRKRLYIGCKWLDDLNPKELRFLRYCGLSHNVLKAWTAQYKTKSGKMLNAQDGQTCQNTEWRGSQGR